jgi:hypothetical protein
VLASGVLMLRERGCAWLTGSALRHISYACVAVAEQSCTSATLPQFDPPQACATVTIDVDTPVIHVAAMYGTNPVILERDNPVLAAYSRALNGNSSEGTAVGLLALPRGSTLAVRPADGNEARRFNPGGKTRKGGQSQLRIPLSVLDSFAGIHGGYLLALNPSAACVGNKLVM